MMFGNFKFRGLSTNLDNGRAGVYFVCSMRMGVVWVFFLSSVMSLIFLPL